MKLHQLSLGYDRGEDRLMLQVSTDRNVEYRFWLTRRMVAALLPALIKQAEHEPAVTQHVEPATRAAVAEFRHQAAVARQSFDKTYVAAEPAPETADKPLLVQQVRMRRAAQGGCVLALGQDGGPAAQLRLGSDLLHGFIRLLTEALAKTDWGITVSLHQAGPRAARRPAH